MEKIIKNQFEDYSKEKIHLEDFIENLLNIQEIYREENKKKNHDLWFRFSKDDTLVTTIQDLFNDLQMSNINRNFTIDRVNDSVVNNSLSIHFS